MLKRYCCINGLPAKLIRCCGLDVLPVGKIDLVKSKLGLGFTAFVTVVAGLTMSLGVCTFFGLSISLSGR